MQHRGRNSETGERTEVEEAASVESFGVTTVRLECVQGGFADCGGSEEEFVPL